MASMITTSAQPVPTQTANKALADLHSSLAALSEASTPFVAASWLVSPPSDLADLYKNFCALLTALQSHATKLSLLSCTSDGSASSTEALEQYLLSFLRSTVVPLKEVTEQLRCEANADLLNEALSSTYVACVKALTPGPSLANAAGSVFYASRPWLYSSTCDFKDTKWPTAPPSRFNNYTFYRRSCLALISSMSKLVKTKYRVVSDEAYYEATQSDDYWEYVYSRSEGDPKWDAVRGAYCETDFEVVKKVRECVASTGGTVKDYMAKIDGLKSSVTPETAGEVADYCRRGATLIVSLKASIEEVMTQCGPETLDVELDGETFKALETLKAQDDTLRAYCDGTGGGWALEVVLEKMDAAKTVMSTLSFV